MMPVLGSVPREPAGKTYCQRHSAAAFGYLRARAIGFNPTDGRLYAAAGTDTFVSIDLASREIHRLEICGDPPFEDRPLALTHLAGDRQLVFYGRQ